MVVGEQFLRRGQIIDAERCVERARLCLEGHKTWMQLHRDERELDLALALLRTMENALLQCEMHRDELVRASSER